MFLIAENLKYAATQIDNQLDGPIYMGGALTQSTKRRQRYCGGGSGYTLNREALKLLVSRMHLPECGPDYHGSDEDRVVADCLRPIVNCTHDVDEMHETRYHPLTPDVHARWKPGDVAPWDPEGLEAFHGIHEARKPGLESISSTSVSFHLVNEHVKNRESNFFDNGLRRFHAITHNLCRGRDKQKEVQKLEEAGLLN